MGLEAKSGAKTDKGGHYNVLVSLTIMAFVTLALEYVIFWAFIAYGAVAIASTEVVWRDAKAINQALGAKVIAASWWSLFAFIFCAITVPLYTFERRKTALSLRR
jgi:hypothetical protein